MAVFTHAYQGCDGAVTSRWHRPLVIFRYAMADLFESRLFSVFFTLCFLPSAVVMVMIYMRYNLELLIQFDLRFEELLDIDAEFFAYWLQRWQSGVSFVLIMLIGPTLVSPDLRNNALSLYLSRSITRTSYVVGKLMVLLVLCSAITWIPAILLILFQSYLGGSEWLLANLHLLTAPILVSLIWIGTLSMISLAVSAWVKWKVLSRLFFFGIFFVGSAISAIIREVFGGWAGSLANIAELSDVLIAGVYGVRASFQMPLTYALSTFLLLTVVSVILLARRIRAFEVSS